MVHRCAKIKSAPTRKLGLVLGGQRVEEVAVQKVEQHAAAQGGGAGRYAQVVLSGSQACWLTRAAVQEAEKLDSTLRHGEGGTAKCGL